MHWCPLPFCIIALLPNLRFPPFWRFTQGRLLDNMEQWIASMEDNGRVQGFSRSVGHCLPRSWRPGKSRHNAASSHTTPILCKADPSWKRTYFAPGVNSRKMVKFSQGRRRAGLGRGTWESGDGGQRDKPRHKRAAWEYFPHNELFICSRHLARGLNNDGIITE